MKMRLTSIILALCISALVFGQEGEAVSSSSGAGLVSKKGVNILPEAGEIALGMDAWPFLQYAGNALSLAGNNAPYVGYGNFFTGATGIYVKYMLTANMAARVNIRADFSSETDSYVVDKAMPSPDPLNPLYVEDEVFTQQNDVHIGLGVEMTRGTSRVQGKYGAELVIGSDKDERTYTYGNSINNENGPEPANFNGYDANGRRIIKDYNDKGLYFGARGFIGVEFFIGPKISLGGEFGYSVLTNSEDKRTQKMEYWNSENQAVSTVYIEESSDGIRDGFKDTMVEIDNLDGEINLFFYF